MGANHVVELNAQMAKDVHNHGRGCGLAMATAHHHTSFVGRLLVEVVWERVDLDVQFTRPNEFGVILGGVHAQDNGIEIGRDALGMPTGLVWQEPMLSQMGTRGFKELIVGARDIGALGFEGYGQVVHNGTANGNEVYLIHGSRCLLVNQLIMWAYCTAICIVVAMYGEVGMRKYGLVSKIAVWFPLLIINIFRVDVGLNGILSLVGGVLYDHAEVDWFFWSGNEFAIDEVGPNCQNQARESANERHGIEEQAKRDGKGLIDSQISRANHEGHLASPHASHSDGHS